MNESGIRVANRAGPQAAGGAARGFSDSASGDSRRGGAAGPPSRWPFTVRPAGQRRSGSAKSQDNKPSVDFTT